MKTDERLVVREVVGGRSSTLDLRGRSSGRQPVQERLWLHIGLYGALLGVLVASLALFVGRGLVGDGLVWEAYRRFYLWMALGSLWFTFLLLFWGEIRQRRYVPYAGERIAVVMPVYNEEPALLRRAITSVVQAAGNKQLVVVNDGSTNGCEVVLEELAARYDLTLHSFDRNRGKRAAMRYGITALARDCAFVVNIDSDTVLDHKALVRVVEPLKTGTIGAVTGEVRLLNEKKNWLTRMVGAYYWSSLNIERQAQSTLGMVSCCSGCLAAYRMEVVRDVMYEFVQERFLGERSTISDDRHLTNLVLREGYDAVYRPEAIAYTVTPETVRGFLKQQLRWRRGYVKESLYSLSFLWKRKPLLFVETILWGLLPPLLSLAVMLTLVVTLVVQPTWLLTLLPIWLFYLFMRNLPLLFKARDKVGGLVLFMLFYYAVLYWQSLYALFTVRSKRWVTR